MTTTNEFNLRCPRCGGEEIKDCGDIFIEDGPYDGSSYRNEHNAPRYSCRCGCHFALVDEPIRCVDCGAFVTGELGEDCQELRHRTDLKTPLTEYLCEECATHGIDVKLEQRDGGWAVVVRSTGETHSFHMDAVHAATVAAGLAAEFEED